MVTAGAQRHNPDPLAKATNPPYFSISFNTSAGSAILEDYFHSIIAASESDPDELLTAFKKVVAEVRTKQGLRGLLRVAQKDSSLDRPGRPSKLTQDDWPELLRLSGQLLPFCKTLAKSKQSARSRPLEDHLDFLRLNHPESVAFLIENLDKMKSVLSDGALLDHIKTPKTRSEKLADIFAGFAFGAPLIMPCNKRVKRDVARAPRLPGKHKSEENYLIFF
jgi:hypothetical protein